MSGDHNHDHSHDHAHDHEHDLAHPLAAAAAGSRGAGASHSSGLHGTISFIAAAWLLQPAGAFTCPAGCTCGSASSECNDYAVSRGGAVATCAECRSMSAIPTLTSDTSVLYLILSPSLGPVISASGFQFPASWSTLKCL